MFKKIITLLCVLAVGTLTYATTLPQEVQDEMKEINNIVFQQVNQTKQEIGLYNFVRKNIEQYYGNTNFKDDNKITGWYRVDKFLNWVKNNEQKLQNSSFKFGTEIEDLQDYSMKDLLKFLSMSKTANIEESQAFWIYLGARYVEYIYDIKCNFSDFAIVKEHITNATGSQVGAQILYQREQKPNVGIKFNGNKKFSLPMLINTGIHESTHLIPHLMSNTFELLPELATFYSEYNFGLPVKSNEVHSFTDTTRDVRRLHNLKPNIQFIDEYNHFIAGIVLNEQLTREQILQFKYLPLLSSDVNAYIKNANILQGTISILMSRNNSFMIEGDLPSIPVTNQTTNGIIEKAKLFNMNEQEISKLINARSLSFDLGERVWPGTFNNKVNVIFKNTKFFVGFIGGLQRFNEDQLLQLQFGEFADNPKLKEFYHKLIAQYLPDEIITYYPKLIPVVTPNDYLLLSLFITREQIKVWQDAILRALNDVTTDSMPVPEGYL